MVDLAHYDMIRSKDSKSDIKTLKFQFVEMLYFFYLLRTEPLILQELFFL